MKIKQKNAEKMSHFIQQYQLLLFCSEAENNSRKLPFKKLYSVYIKLIKAKRKSIFLLLLHASFLCKAGTFKNSPVFSETDFTLRLFFQLFCYFNSSREWASMHNDVPSWVGLSLNCSEFCSVEHKIILTTCTKYYRFRCPVKRN